MGIDQSLCGSTVGCSRQDRPPRPLWVTGGQRFGGKRRFRKAFEAERDLFFEVPAEPDEARSDPAEKRSDAELLAFVRGEDNSWSQDEGLALFLLLERMAPVWQRRVLGAELATPLYLLEDALGMSHCHPGEKHDRVGSN